MINIYKSFSQRWQNVVRRFALSVWRHQDDESEEKRYFKQALNFSRDYRYDLEKKLADKGIHVYRGTLDGKVNDWLTRQKAMADTIRVMATDRKDEIIAKEIEKLQKNKDANVQEEIDRLYEMKQNQHVYKAFSFEDHFEGASDRIGDDEAFGLGRDLNEEAIRQSTDRYFWRKQNDNRVRKTHEMLADKCFLFIDPPTTIDKYGNKHTGNVGTDFGCRCFADPAPAREKPKRNYVVKEK